MRQKVFCFKIVTLITASGKAFCGFSYVPDEPAALISANRKGVGNSFPRFSARRRMPLQAVLLKKYRCGTSPVSKTSDNEHASAALWNSEILSVKNSVGEPIPDFPQRPEEDTKIFSSVR